MSPTKTNRNAPAAVNVLGILRYLSSHASPVRAAMIAREVGLPRSTTYELLQTLMEEGFVVHLPDEFKYALGEAAHELGTGFSRQTPIQRMARVPVAKLVARTRRTAHLGVMHGREVLYVIEERAPRQRHLVTDTGVRLPAHLTASGRAMLAWMDKAQVAALYPGPEAFTSRTAEGPGSLLELLDLLQQFRTAGFSWEQDEITTGFSSVAVPVLDRNQRPVASVALTVANRAAGPTKTSDAAGPHEREISVQTLGRTCVPEIALCAREISRRLG